MRIQTKIAVSSVTVILLICNSKASNPVFLQAISSALATIPLTGFPMTMTAGIAGAKLAVGGKLLYFLGLFGRRGQNKPPSAMPPMFPSIQMGQAGFGSMPMPGFGGPFPGNQFPSFGQGVPSQSFSANGMQSQKLRSPGGTPIDPAVLMDALAEQGINPLQLMTALESAGIDPTQLMQSLSSGGEGGTSSNSLPPMGGPGKRAGQSPPAFPPKRNVPSRTMSEMPHDLSDSLPPDSNQLENSQSNSEDVESFFSFLRDMDDNGCISRLICDIGSDPDFLGDFSRNIDTIINSLEVSPESGAYPYIQIMEDGRSEGRCSEKFPECDEEAYEIVRSVAPSVGVPSGVSSEAVNKL